MKIDLTVNEMSLLMELMQEWKTHRPYDMSEINVINGIVNKMHEGATKWTPPKSTSKWVDLIKPQSSNQKGIEDVEASAEG